ncbi:hypothetical protein HQ529_04005 [Candidatus Woesearchaeota archaeon]|nr:hypothetical protein [Candidatus Woesearchaeota archaeon]
MVIITYLKGSREQASYDLFKGISKNIIRRKKSALMLLHSNGCPDCPEAVRAFEIAVKDYYGETGFYSVNVGTISEWKREDKNGRASKFITDDLNVKSIPTILLYISGKLDSTNPLNSSRYDDHVEEISDLIKKSEN